MRLAPQRKMLSPLWPLAIHRGTWRGRPSEEGPSMVLHIARTACSTPVAEVSSVEGKSLLLI